MKKANRSATTSVALPGTRMISRLFTMAARKSLPVPSNSAKFSVPTHWGFVTPVKSVRL